MKYPTLPLLTLIALAAACSQSPEEAPPVIETAPAVSEAATPAPMSSEDTFEADPDLPLLRVWKSPTCGCCGDWVEHMKAAGFSVEVHQVTALTDVKEEHSIEPQHRSCHTATVDGYVVEGHVPADLVQRMLEERPEIRGLAVPGMPVGSPGMEVGDQTQPYDVLALLTGGSTMIYASR